MAEHDIIGAMPPPPGVVPNFENGESNAIHVILASVLCPAFALPLVVVRFYTAKRALKIVRPDDCEAPFSGYPLSLCWTESFADSAPYRFDFGLSCKPRRGNSPESSHANPAHLVQPQLFAIAYSVNQLVRMSPLPLPSRYRSDVVTDQPSQQQRPGTAAAGTFGT